MDAYEATRVVFSRIQALDPENASKIMGLLLIQDHGEKEMIRLALGPESLLQSLILKSRKEINLSSSLPTPFNSSPRLLPSPTSWASSPQPFSRANNGSLEEAPPCSEDIYGEVLDDQGLGFYADGMGGWGGGSLGWKPCLYFARGYCKNGASCRFLHDEKLDAATAAAVSLEQEILLRSKSQSPRPSQLMASAFPYSPTGKGGIGFLLQQQTESQRAAAVAALMANSSADEAGRFMVRSPRLERSDLAVGLNNPGARQIYLTFPADSTFSEEDVSNYFSIYGPVQDVRIPYQQKRMFGFVTFVYPETVKLILAKGNPHFVCDARVLVKPYKEKGKVPEKYRSKNLQAERGDFSGCSSPTGLLDTRDPFELPHLGARMLYGTSPTQEAFLRRKLEEQQQQLELQQAIELQGRRFMGLQLLDLKNRTLNSPTITAPSPIAEPKSSLEEDATNQDKKACSNIQSAPSGVTDVRDPPKVNGSHEVVVKESGAEAAPTKADCGSLESGLEHNLPDSPFASPTKSCSQILDTPFLPNEPSNRNNSISAPFMSTPLIPPSSIDLASYNSCFFQMPRFSSGHGAIGM